ncbi:hypothetical protein CPY51_10520 [Rhizobium tubonense]|uniref:Band 7 domain-containing protein n=1 Tax=Rhizobium tubonense TaxID=484088 RepID=A0A2W4CNV9_9HYPH|nr:hypothetical protein CPY51_10520 [Rhizobium tubonense]
MDNDIEAVNPTERIRFQRSAIHARQLSTDASRVGIVAAAFLLAACLVGSFASSTMWLPFFCSNAAALIVLGSGLRSGCEVASWRRERAGLPSLPRPAWLRWMIDAATSPWRSPSEEPLRTDTIERLSGRAATSARAAVQRVGSRAVLQACLSLLALLTVYAGVSWDFEQSTPGRAAYIAGGFCLALAFALLVIERRFASSNLEELPEAGSLMLLTRLPIVTLVASAFCLLMVGAGQEWLTRLMVLSGCFAALVALELLIRALLAMFSPQNSDIEPQLIADSFVAGTLRWPPRPFSVLRNEIKARYGIDLRQIWAISFIRRAAPAVICLILFIGWLLSGVSEVPMTGRGIYERFGKPESVVHSGLHAGLPWPFGRVVPVENGVVHELATSLSDKKDGEPLADAEGPAPEITNRLWDGSHISEKSQIIASRTDGKQSFQIVNMDIRFVYRIGLSDQAALNAAYQTSDPAALIESTASRVLVHDFAARTLDDVLGETRAQLAVDISSAIRKDLDRLNSGVEILAVVVEAIHPPAGAANAYHAVQASQITAEALVARERGHAAERANDAQLNASIERDKAVASARESIAASEVAKLRFAAEQTAYDKAGQVFLTETYFARLTAGLAHSKALILDHRIGGNLAPTFDLRTTMPPIDPDAAGETSAPAPSEEVNP